MFLLLSQIRLVGYGVNQFEAVVLQIFYCAGIDTC